MNNKIKITKEQLDKLLSMKDPAIMTNGFTKIGDGDILECNETHEYYIITSCSNAFEIFGKNIELILPNPKKTIDLRNGNLYETYFTFIYKLCKLAGTLEINLDGENK